MGTIEENELNIKRLEQLVRDDELTVAANNDTIKRMKEDLERVGLEYALRIKEHEKYVSNNEIALNDFKTIKEKNKLEIESTKSELAKLKDESSRCIRLKEEEIEKLETEILKEKQIVAQVQLTQEKDILEKEGEIRILNTILTQERKILLDKEAEVEKLKA